jgi:hypothetical protein
LVISILRSGTPGDGRRTWLTADGYDLLIVAEDTLLASFSGRSDEPGRR